MEENKQEILWNNLKDTNTLREVQKYIEDMNEEALSKLEKEFKIKPASDMTLEDRKTFLLSILKGIGVTNVEKLKTIAKTYECGDIEVIQNYSSYSIIIKFVSILGIPKRLNDLKKAIEKVVPCHLGISYEIKYNTLNDLTPYTLQEFVTKGLTLEDLPSGDLKTL